MEAAALMGGNPTVLMPIVDMTRWGRACVHHRIAGVTNVFREQAERRMVALIAFHGDEVGSSRSGELSRSGSRRFS